MYIPGALCLCLCLYGFYCRYKKFVTIHLMIKLCRLQTIQCRVVAFMTSIIKIVSFALQAVKDGTINYYRYGCHDIKNLEFCNYLYRAERRAQRFSLIFVS